MNYSERYYNLIILIFSLFKRKWKRINEDARVTFKLDN